MPTERRRSSTSRRKSSSSSSSSSSSFKSSLVYIPDDTYAWLPAKICSMDQEKAQVQVLPLSNDDTIVFNNYDNHKNNRKTVRLPLPAQNKTAQRDMADLRHLHEAAILYNLKERHYQSKPYTRVGDIVVAMNPFVWLPDLYTPEKRSWYANALCFSSKDEEEEETEEEEKMNHHHPANHSEYDKLGHDPHVYETSCLAYRGMWQDQQHQTILVTGESGAGKTETVKIVMTHLATIQQEEEKTKTTTPDHNSIMKSVLQSNPILEAFGNAQTLRNDNSSRFGKLTELQFDWNHYYLNTTTTTTTTTTNSQAKATGVTTTTSSSSPPPPLAGSICTTYLLEKSRVVGQSLGERNYHVFYQLLSASGTGEGDDFKEWVWKDYLDKATCDDFVCLQTNGGRIHNENDRRRRRRRDEHHHHTEWSQTLEALHVFGFTGEKLRTLLRALCCVLQLSNIEFAEEEIPDNPELEGPTVISSHKSELEKLEDILGIDPLFLEEAMTKRNMKVGGHGDMVKVQLSPAVAKESCHALAKEIYARLFQILVTSINEKTKGEQPSPSQQQQYRRRRRRRPKSEVGNNERKKKFKKKRRNSGESSRDSSNRSSERRRRRERKSSRRRGSDASNSSSSETSSNYYEYQNNGTADGSSSRTTTSAASANFGIICLLDIFGFERFDVNRFEQLCINYANEHLQNKYVLDNFGRIQEEYESEGIDLFDFRLVDNSPILTVLEHKLSGVLTALHEECIRPKGNDESFVYKIKVVHSSSPILVSEKLHRKTEFGIQHFAGLVTYDSTDFVERNTDQLPVDLIRCVAQHSTNDLIRSEFQILTQQLEEEEQQQQQQTTTTMQSSVNNNKKKKKKNKTTVLQTFRVQLQDLMNRLSPMQTRYIRCIKPNQDMIPRKTDHHSTMRQLECAGLVTAITISRETYPNKLDYGTCQYRFECLLLLCQKRRKISSIVSQTYQALTKKQQEVDKDSDDFKVGRKETVRFLLSNLIPPDIVRRQSITATTTSKQQQHQQQQAKKEPFACGNTKVYFRAGVLEYLENERLDYYTERVIQIQSWFRCLSTTEWYQHLSKVVIQVQSYARRQLTLLAVQKWKIMAYRIYSAIRIYQARTIADGLRQNKAAVQIQTTWRRFQCQRLYQTVPTAVRILQRTFRTYRRIKVRAEQAKSRRKEARMDEKLLALHAQVNKSILHIQNSSDTTTTTATSTATTTTMTNASSRSTNTTTDNHSNRTAGSSSEEQQQQRSHDAAAAAALLGATAAASDNGSSQVQQQQSLGRSPTTTTTSNGGGKRRVVNEELLQEVESMFEYLRQEMNGLRTTNSALQDELQTKDTTIQDWKGRTQAAEAAAVAQSLTVTKLTKQNSTYEQETTEHRAVVQELKKQLRQSSTDQEEGFLQLRHDFQRVIDQKDDQMESLRNRYAKAVKMHQKDLAILTAQHNKSEEELFQENLRLKEEWKRTQESHHEYLAKLMDVLETTHQTREEETAKISKELQMVKEEKNATISKLQTEIAGLKQTILTNHHNNNNNNNNGFGYPNIASSRLTQNHHPSPTLSPKLVNHDNDESEEDVDKNQISQVSALRTTMERNKEARAQRNQQFQEVSSRLFQKVGSADPLIELVTSSRKAQVEEKTKGFAKMISFLEELYHLEETSQHELNDDILEMMDSYLLHCQPNVAMKQLQDGYEKIHEENRMLKQQALTQGHCPRCEARHKRRIATKKGTLQQQNTTTPPTRPASPMRKSQLTTPSQTQQRSATPSRAVSMRRRRSLSASRAVRPEESAENRAPQQRRRSSSTIHNRGRDKQPAPLLPRTSASATGNKTPPPPSNRERRPQSKPNQKQRESPGFIGTTKVTSNTAATKDKTRRGSLGKTFAKSMGFGGGQNNKPPSSSHKTPEELVSNASSGGSQQRSSRLRGGRQKR